MNTEDQDLAALTQLGQATRYPTQYDAGLLLPLPRAPKRAELGIKIIFSATECFV